MKEMTRVQLQHIKVSISVIYPTKTHTYRSDIDFLHTELQIQWYPDGDRHSFEDSIMTGQPLLHRAFKLSPFHRLMMITVLLLL